MRTLQALHLRLCRLAAVAAACFIAAPVLAQEADTSAMKGIVYAKETPDSVLREKVFFYHYDPFRVKIDELHHPTLSPTGLQFNDPLDALNGNYYLSTGVIGHPHLELFPTFADGLSHCLNADEHTGYAKTPGSVRFYQTLTPYSALAYGSSLNKDYHLHVAHTQNIRPGWNASFDYDLLNPEGVFTASAARNHYLDATTNYYSADSRLQVLAGFIFQRYTLDENGGLSDDTYFTSGRQTNQAGLPMRYGNAGSVSLRHDFFGRASYNLVQQVEEYRQRDSLAFRYDTIRLDSLDRDTIVVAVDTIGLTDTLPVGQPRMLNAGVAGAEWAYHRSKRAAFMPAGADSTLWTDLSAALFWTNDAYPDHRWRNPLKLTLGIKPRRLGMHLYADTLSGTSIFNPYGRAELALGRLTLAAEGEMDHTLSKMFATVDDADWLGKVSLGMALDSAERHTVCLLLAASHTNPEARMLQTARRTLEPQDAQRFEMQYRMESTQALDLTLRATHLSHHLWYDTALAVHQGDQDLWLLQASLTARLQLGWLHLDMQHLLQHSTDDGQLSVPLFATKNSLYADMYLFHRALRLQIGVDLRFHTKFYAYAYHPGTGLFVEQDEQEVGGYLWGDVFINLQIKRAGIYLKAGHLNALWENQPTYMLLPHYPGQRFGLFWGVTWKFFD